MYRHMYRHIRCIDIYVHKCKYIKNHGIDGSENTHLAELILPVHQEMVNMLHSVLKLVPHPSTKFPKDERENGF